MCMGVGMCMICAYVWSCTVCGYSSVYECVWECFHICMYLESSHVNWIRPKFVCDMQKRFWSSGTKVNCNWGLPNLIEYCRLRRNWALHSYLIQQNSSSPPGIVHVHPQCRRSFVDPKRLKALDEQPQTPSPKKQKLRSANDEFQWKVNCFLCGKVVLFDHKHPDRYNDSRIVRTIPFRS